MTTTEIIQYYVNLLIIEYATLPRARATIETQVTPVVMPQADINDPTLPLAVLDGFNLFGDNIAVGAQLDVIGKYVGASRIGYNLSMQVILSDAEYLKLIHFAILYNNNGSSLADIQAIIAEVFPGEMFVYDYTNMHMSYLISSSAGSKNLFEMMITQGFLPRPMGVMLDSVVYAPVDVTKLFRLRTYAAAAPVGSSPMNTYASYSLNSPMLSYADALPI